MKAAKRKKVVLGIDDRVPSQIAASLLRNQDFDLLAVHLSVDLGDRASLYPSALRRPATARIQASCDALGIPLRVIDVTGEVLAKVYDPYWISTLSGTADAPGVRWLRDLLIPHLASVARQFGADHIATGHFARNAKGIQRYSDAELDQSPTFGTVAAGDLARLLLPIGEVSPEMIVRLAIETGALAKPSGDEAAPAPRDVLLEDRAARGNWGWGLLLKSPEVQARAATEAFRPGPYRSSDELIIGDHEGIAFHSIGDPVSGHFGQFVVEIHPQTRAITIGGEPYLRVEKAFLKELSWTDPAEDSYGPREVRVEAIPVPPRSLARPKPRTPPVRAMLFQFPGRLAEIRFQEPARALAPGQTLAFSSETRIIGAATVAEVVRAPVPRAPAEDASLPA